MFQRLHSEKVFCGLDLGSSHIKACLLGVQDDGVLDIIGVYEVPTHGFDSGSVTDLGELTECIGKAVGGLSRRTGVQVKEIHIGLTSALVEIRETGAVAPLADRGNKVIGEKDIRLLNKQARLLGLKVDEEVLHDIPQHYVVDDLNTALNPLGLSGRKVGVSSLLVVAQTSRLQNITRAVHQAGYDIASFFLNILSASDVVFDDEDKNRGAVLIDVGSSKTSLLIFKDKSLKFLESIPIGGDSFTRRIAQELSLAFDVAEEIKKSYAGALSSDQNSDEEILVKKDSVYIPLKRQVICTAIEPEIRDLVRTLARLLKDSGYMEYVHRGITVIGGGALLPGLMERIAEETKMTVQLAKVRVPSTKPLSHVATYSSALGLSYSGFKKKRRSKSLAQGEDGWAKSAIERLKVLYHEYF